MSPFRVIFRTDASVRIGIGHVMRCLTLAEALRQRGAECRFICREHEGHLLEQIRQRGFDAYALPVATEFVESAESAESGFREDAIQSTWLGSDWATDAAQTKAGAGQTAVDWVIVDHYSLDARWERVMRPICKRLMVIDDIANRPHLCDFLLDQNYEDENRYKKFVTKSCRLLLGPRYAILRPEYAEYRAKKTFKIESVKKVLVFFGGSDPLDLTGTTLKALSVSALNELEVDVVVGANYLHHDSLKQIALLRGNVVIHQSRPHLADLMARADIGIGAGGVTNWERICLGLPSLVIVIAENQAPISDILNKSGVIRLLGKAENITEKSISEALLDEIQSQQFISRIAPAMALCDGLGVSRVANKICSFQ
jgi:UDP-2,4-diacetamido-2,4,6-trideoxy-beta-L-altropyranose hydrolase